MVGAGVFTTSGYTLASLGSPLIVIFAWAVGGAIAICGAISYGYLVRAMPESGGEYLFLSRAVHPMLGFVAGWVSLIAGFTGAIAVAATALESYVLPQPVRPDWLPQGIVAVAAIVACGVFHGLRPLVGTWFQNLAVILKLGLLVLFLFFAAFYGPSDGWQGAALPEFKNMSSLDLVFAFANSLVWISLSYLGFNAAVYVADEATDAKKIVPRALILGTCIVTILYIFLNAVFIYAPPSTAIAGQPDIAAISAKYLGGNWLALFVRGIVTVALLTSVSSMLMAAPRVYAKMADDRLLPKILQFRGNAPTLAVIAQVILAASIVIISDLQQLISYLGLTLSLSAACSVGCLFLPKVYASFGSGRPVIAPAIYVAATIITSVLMTTREWYNTGVPWQIIATALTFTVGAIIYLLAVITRPTDESTEPGDDET